MVYQKTTFLTFQPFELPSHSAVRNGAYYLSVLDQNIDCVSVISFRCDFLQFVLNNRALVSCQPMGDGLRELCAVIGCWPPEMTYTPLSLSSILREIEFISIHIKMILQLKLSNSYETWQYTVQPIAYSMFIQFILRIYYMKLITTKQSDGLQ